jgi:pyruvate,water dikinase
MVNARNLVVWLKDVDKEDAHHVGEKAANLGEMIQAGFPVPGGFAITASAYSQFLHLNKLETKIGHLLNTINYNDPNSLDQVSKHIKNIINVSEIPKEISTSIFNFYEHMDAASTSPLVAIRRSAISENSKETSHTGQQETFLNVSGESALIAKVREAWASLFEAGSIYYRHQNNISHTSTKITLAIQKMVESEVSGIMFTIDPVTNNRNTIVIEAIYGLGEYIAQGHVTPDHYEIDKNTGGITHKTIANQNVRFVKSGTVNKEEKVPKSLQNKQKITDEDIQTLATFAKKLEEHYYFPQDCEWAKEKGKFFIVQTKPVTMTQGKREDGKEKNEFEIRSLKSENSTKPFLIGEPVSPGIGIGKVKIVKSLRDIGKINRGDILAAEYTNPDYVPALRKAVAIITEKDGRASHVALVSREFGIPAIVGVPGLLAKLKDGMMLTVNGKTGEIMQGSMKVRDLVRKDTQNLETKTKVLANLSDPELAQRVADEHVDGIGLLRAEFMIAGLGVHPKKLIHEKRSKEFTQTLIKGISQVCQAFYPRPVVYRATDFTSNEYTHLKGGHEYEPIEPNPMLGYRGTYRYITDPKVFMLELEAVKKIREKYNNLNLVLPFVRTINELEQAKKIISSSGLQRSDTFKLYMMCELPSNVIRIEEFLEAGIDGVSIGLNDLTMLLLGTDRDNEEVAREYDEQDPAVLWAFERVIAACKKKGVPVSVCGEFTLQYPELVKKLVEWGISSISVSPDVIDLTREFVYKAERG